MNSTSLQGLDASEGAQCPGTTSHIGLSVTKDFYTSHHLSQQKRYSAWQACSLMLKTIFTILKHASPSHLWSLHQGCWFWIWTKREVQALERTSLSLSHTRPHGLPDPSPSVSVVNRNGLPASHSLLFLLVMLLLRCQTALCAEVNMGMDGFGIIMAICISFGTDLSRNTWSSLSWGNVRVNLMDRVEEKWSSLFKINAWILSRGQEDKV